MNTSLFERNGGTYSVVSGYHIPNLALSYEPEYQIGLWGKRRLEYLKARRRVLYINLLASGMLPKHLLEVDMAALERWETIVQQMARTQDVTEQLKSENQLLWVGKMNNIRACADEFIRSELIFD